MSFSLKNISSNVSAIRFKTEEHAPALALIMGLAGLGWATYETVKSVRKVDAIMEEVEERQAVGEEVKPMETVTRVVGAVYKPVVIGTLSVGVILKGFHVLNNRVSALSAALATANSEYTKLRRYIQEKHPEEDFLAEDGEVYLNAEEEAKGDKGEKVKAKKPVNEQGYNGCLFSNSEDYNPNDHIGNQVHVSQVCRILCNKLASTGYLRLSEVLAAYRINPEKIGINPRTAEVVGWRHYDTFFDVDFKTFTSKSEDGYARPDLIIEWPAPQSLVGRIDHESKIMHEYNY